MLLQILALKLIVFFNVISLSSHQAVYLFVICSQGLGILWKVQILTGARKSHLEIQPLCVSEHQHNALAGGKSSQSLLPASSNSCSQWIDKPKSSLCSDSLGTWSGLSGRLTPAKSPFKCPVILPAWSLAHCYNLPKCHRYYYPGSLPTCAQVPTERWGQQKVVVTTGYRQRKDAGQLGRTISEGKGRW